MKKFTTFAMNKRFKRLKHYRVMFMALFFYLFPVIRSATSDSNEIILKKNLFSPDRKEKSHKKPEKEKHRIRKKKLRKKNIPVLCGTIIKGDEKVAIIKKRKRGRKQDIYYIGDFIGDFEVVEINHKSVVLDFYGKKIVLGL